MKKTMIVIIIILMILEFPASYLLGYTNGVNTSNYTTFNYNELLYEIEELEQKKDDIEVAIEHDQGILETLQRRIKELK